MQKTQTSINTQGFNQVANLMLQFRKFSLVRNQGNWQIKEENTKLIIKLY